MGFLKKNIGLVAFLILCLGVVVYFVLQIMEAGKRSEANQQKREEHLKLLKDIRGKGLRLDEENLEKAQQVADQAKACYDSFVKQLGAKRLLPGIDFSKDPDEEGAAKEEPELDEDGKPIVKVDLFKNNPNRKRFDSWMAGSLFDAREALTNELIKINLVDFKNEEDDEDDEEDDDDEFPVGRNDTVAKTAAAAKAPADDKAAKKADDEKSEAEKKAISDTKAELDKNKSAYDVQKEMRLKIIKGSAVPEYFMFTEYVTNRESGLRNNKEKRGVFRQLILLDELIKIMRQAEIAELNSIDFPCGLEILDGDKFTYTPITISVTGNPERIEAFLNLLNANEKYIFYLRDITSFDATVKLNADANLVFNSGVEPGYVKLDNFLKAAGTQVESVGGMGGAGMREGGRGAAMPGADELGGGRRRRGRDKGPQNMDRMEGGMGGGPDMMEQKAQQIIRTRKSYRVFADANEKKDDNRAERGMMGGGMPGGEDEQKNISSAAEKGTTVTLSLNFEFVEFKVANE